MERREERKTRWGMRQLEERGNRRGDKAWRPGKVEKKRGKW